jgi:uncharacterized protein
MIVYVKEIIDSPGKSFPFVWDGPFEGEGVSLKGNLLADFSLSFVGSRIIVQGTMSGEIRALCARCDEPFYHPVSLGFFESFVPVDSPEAAEKEEMDLSDLEIFTYDENRLDLHEVIRQNLVASIPIKPLCREDCRGLCPACGINLNVEQCSCSVEKIDSRLAGLAALRDKLQHSEAGTAPAVRNSTGDTRR